MHLQTLLLLSFLQAKAEAEAAGVEVEGEHALDSSGMMAPVEMLPEQCHLEEGEERWMITPESRDE